MRKKPFKYVVRGRTSDYTKKELEVKLAAARLYASSPYLSATQKKKFIKDMFKKKK